MTERFYFRPWLSTAFIAFHLGVCLLAISAAHTAGAAGYFVAQTGNDLNPGTEAQPWLTISKAAKTLQAGDTVYVKAGTYHERVTIKVQGNAAGGYITFQNYGHDTVIVDGTGFDLLNPWGGVIEAFGKSYVLIKGFHVQNASGGTSILVSGDTGASHVQIVNNEVSAHSGINAIGCRGSNLSQVLVDSNEVHDCNTHGEEAIRVDKGTTYFVISNNVVHDNTNIGIEVCGWGVQPAYGLVKNNTCYHNSLTSDGAHGIYVDGGTYTLVENNICFDNWGGISIGDEYAGESSHHVIVRRNLVYNNWRRGINLGAPQSGGRPEACSLVHNVCCNNNVDDWSSEITVDHFQGAHQIKNNICYNTKSANPLIIFYSGDAALISQIAINYNCDFPASAGFSCLGTVYHSFSDWQSGTGQDANSLSANPAVTSVTAFDFHLQAGSPCIDAGAFLANASASGSGVVLTVDNASAFCDGYNGLFPGDSIRVGNQSPVDIVQVDYANNRLTLSQPLAWTANDGVSLAYSGSRPDIGAYEYGTPTAMGSISGVVADQDSGAVLPGAIITTGIYSATSGADGGYVLNVPAGPYELTCAQAGYQSQAKYAGIVSGSTVLLNWRLKSTAAAGESKDFTVTPGAYVRGKSPSEKIHFGNLPPEATIILYTVTCRTVKTIRHQSSLANGSEDWDIHDMASGIYIYRISAGQKEKRGKIAVVK